jgi:hypothetical protein
MHWIRSDTINSHHPCRLSTCRSTQTTLALREDHSTVAPHTSAPAENLVPWRACQPTCVASAPLVLNILWQPSRSQQNISRVSSDATPPDPITFTVTVRFDGWARRS